MRIPLPFWQNDNPLIDDVIFHGKTPVRDETAQVCRVLFQNLWEPPVPEAVVMIDMLTAEINYEDVMDKVTDAMSAEKLIFEAIISKARQL